MVQIAFLLLMVVVHGVEGADATTEQVAYVGQDAVLRCPLTAPYAVSYPGWGKVGGIVYTLFGGSINPDSAGRGSYASDNTSLVITNITLSDDGSHRCSTTIDGGLTMNTGFNTLHTRIRPQPPVISNRQSDGTMTGTEGQSLTLTCTSRDGYPEPTVTLFRGSNQSTALVISNSGPREGDGYTVTATYTFAPTSSYVGSIYICQTSYTSPKLDVLDSVNATLRLNRKPSQPTVKQVGDVVAGSTVAVNCKTSGFRPAESITISWTYNGVTYPQHVTTTPTSGTDTYTATSTLQFTVQKVYNGGRAECIVAHSTLGTPLTGTATIDVHFAPVSAAVEGNDVIVANGLNPLTLTCVVGESNPAVTSISWTRTSRTGTVSTQNPLVLRPTRDDDRDTVTCTANNGIGSGTSDSVTLDLNFHPITTITGSPPGAVTEGPTDVTLQCSAHSKPAPTITWYHNGDTLQGGQLLTGLYVSTYKITSVRRQDAGEYKCIATNTVSPPSGDTSNTAVVTLVVRFPPESAIIEGNLEIEADGHKKLQLKCVVGESNPISTITWSKTGTVDIGTKRSMQDATGSYGGSTLSQVLELTPTRDDDGATITCTAGNGVTHTITLTLKFHPITTLTGSPPGAVTEGPTDVTLQCSAHSKPAATITWYHNGGTLQGGQLSTTAHNTYVSTYNITSVSRHDYGEYRCIATNTISPPTGDTSNTAVVTLVVQFPPQSAIIEVNRVIEADGHNMLELNCVVGESKPISTITWSKTGTVDIETKRPTQDADGSYGGRTRSQALVLMPTRDTDGDTITCTADNGVTRTITLYLKFSAKASIPLENETVVEGAPSKDLTCNADSKPAANFTWYKGTSSTALASGPGTASGNQWTSTYTIVGADRSHTGQYRCDAYNGVGASDEKTMTLIVYYPPDVTATVQLTDGQLVATCSPSGIPTNYNYSPWVHLWSDDTHISQPQLAHTQILRLTHPTYQDSGIYKCGAGNGVGLNGAMSANYKKEGCTSAITIKSLPIIIGSVEQKVPIQLHKPSTVSVTYYSNVAGSTVSCHRVVDNITQTQSVGVVTTDASPIQLYVYGSVVSEHGNISTITLTFDDKAELGAYVVKINNIVGTAVVHLLAVPEGPPFMLIDPRVEDVYTTSVNVSWELGYHGGPGQIFIIQYSTDGETWTDGATLDTGKSTSQDRHYVTVDSLNPGTLYSLRIHAYNQHGSRDTDMINVTTSTIGADGRMSSSAVGPAVGGSVAALIVIALVVGLVVLHRKGYSILRPCTEKSNKYRDHTYENEVETNETGHEMCQARAASTTRDEGQAAALPYERLTTTRVTTSTMYDELNITGAGLVGDTTREGSVAGPYETLEPRQGENATFYEELRPRELPEHGHEVKNERESSGDEELERLTREVAQAKDKKRRLKLEQKKERLRAELEKTNKEVAQIMNRDDRVMEYENLKIK